MITNITDLKLNFEFLYKDIENIANSEDLTLTELGEDIIGENFLVLKNQKNSCICFMLTGYTSRGSIYKVIYTNF
jgi:hypothetical protein